MSNWTSVTGKSTPGPWLIAGVTDRIDDGYGDGRFVYALDAESATNRFSACVQNDNHKASDEELRANARLIAAAPDLLEALKSLVGQWENGTLSWEDDMPAAKAAIAKATTP
jgi:hypothetical protein